MRSLSPPLRSGQPPFFEPSFSPLYISLLPCPPSHPKSIPFPKAPISNQRKRIPLMASLDHSNFQDFLPLMAEKLGGDELIGELCNGFRLLSDPDKGVITFESLKKNAPFLGLQGFSDTDLFNMLREGDFDGDGVLNQMEFCVLMFRLSPELMAESEFLFEEFLQQEGFQDSGFSL